MSTASPASPASLATALAQASSFTNVDSLLSSPTRAQTSPTTTSSSLPNGTAKDSPRASMEAQYKEALYLHTQEMFQEVKAEMEGKK